MLSLLRANLGPRSARGVADTSGGEVIKPTFASSWRIAKRAVSGALKDPTGGAVRCHELGSSPAWATGLNPSTWIGSYLFYDDLCGEEEDRKPAVGTEATADPRGRSLRVE